MAIFWKNLIQIPEEIFSDDFVLRLSKGIKNSEETLRNYVVTEQIAARFHDALILIRKAVKDNSRRAAFLHGSFGSGKSHFMAVLHLLLSNDPHAQTLEGLAPIIRKHPWMKKKEFLLVPFHFIGARDIESAIFGGYAEYIKEKHPEAPLPGVFLGDHLLEDAKTMRSMDEIKFFKMLNQGNEQTSGWGNFNTRWTTENYEKAIASPPGHSERHRVLGDLATYVFKSAFSSSQTQTTNSKTRFMAESERFVNLDLGLRIIAEHAQMLGYDAMILFLDELVLWLMTTADTRLMQREAPKIVKLVESASSQHPIPTISFIARQRNFQEFMGDASTGEEGKILQDALNHMSARLSTIELNDRDLPIIIEKRLLVRTNPKEEEIISSSFNKLYSNLKLNQRNVLDLTGNDSYFRRVFPFTPALIDALVALSSVLQRERTALRLLLQLLVNNRNSLTLGQIIPVGELWDVVADGGQPFAKDIRQRFNTAKKLWKNKLGPALANLFKLDFERLHKMDPIKVKPFNREALLLKTILMASLVPSVKSLKNLTVAKLWALNYGTVLAMIPGNEENEIKWRLKQISNEVPALQFTKGNFLFIRLTRVDVDALLDRVEGEDNHSRRINLLKESIFDLCEIDKERHFAKEVWKGRTHRIKTVFSNVRTLNDTRLISEENLKIIIDYPYDETPGRSSRDDMHRLDEFQKQLKKQNYLVVWLPQFLSHEGVKLLQKVVRLEVLMKQKHHFDDLPIEQRIEAKNLIQIMFDQNIKTLKEVLQSAYFLTGNEGIHENYIEKDDQITCFRSTIQGHESFLPPQKQTFKKALSLVIQKALTIRYPKTFDLPDIDFSENEKRKIVRTFFDAYDLGDNNFVVSNRTIRDKINIFCVPLRLVLPLQSNSDHFALDSHWVETFTKKFDKNPTVLQIREALDSENTGLERIWEDLIIHAFSAMGNKNFLLNGKIIDITTHKLVDEMELIPTVVPTEKEWKELGVRIHKIFSNHILSLMTIGLPSARNINKIYTKLMEQVDPVAEKIRTLPKQLLEFGSQIDMTKDEISRTHRYRLANEFANFINMFSNPIPSIALIEASKAKLSDINDAGECVKNLLAIRQILSREFHAFKELSFATSDKEKQLLLKIKKIFSCRESRLNLGRLDSLHEEAFRLLIASKKTTQKITTQKSLFSNPSNPTTSSRTPHSTPKQPSKIQFSSYSTPTQPSKIQFSPTPIKQKFRTRTVAEKKSTRTPAIQKTWFLQNNKELNAVLDELRTALEEGFSLQITTEK